MIAFSAEVNTTLKALDGALNAVTARTESLNNSISAIPMRLDQLETNVIGAAKLIGDKVSADPASLSSVKAGSDLVEVLLRNSALSANLLQYACVLANKSKKPIDMKVFCKAIEADIPAWTSGFLACMNAVDVITIEAIAGSPRAYMVSMVNSVLKQRARPYFVTYVNGHFDDEKDELDAWLRKLSAVEDIYQ
jgi:hypothetical protein